MDHNEAIQMQAAEKYILGELPAALRDEYEEHFFDCAECALDVKAAAAFADNSREVMKQEAKKERSQDPAPHGGGWLAWFRPVVAVPAFAVLLLALGYQSLISVPHWKKAATESAAPRVLPMFSLIAANTRGSDSLTFRVLPGQRFGLYLDVPADDAYRTYLMRLEDPAGHTTTLRSLSFDEARKTQVVEVNPGSRSGAYQIVVSGLTGKDTDPGKALVLATMKFIVEFSK
jgi:hypothetical protein